jgi:hypothetical protein
MDPASVTLDCAHCNQRVQAMATVAVRESETVIAAMLHKCATNSSVGNFALSLQLCNICLGKVENSIRRGRERIWTELPGIFGMSDWEVLRSEQLFFAGDGSSPLTQVEGQPLK